MENIGVERKNWKLVAGLDPNAMSELTRPHIPKYLTAMILNACGDAHINPDLPTIQNAIHIAIRCRRKAENIQPRGKNPTPAQTTAAASLRNVIKLLVRDGLPTDAQNYTQQNQHFQEMSHYIGDCINEQQPIRSTTYQGLCRASERWHHHRNQTRIAERIQREIEQQAERERLEQERNATQPQDHRKPDHPNWESLIQSQTPARDENCKAQGRAMRKQRAESPVRFTGLKPDPHIGEDATHPQGDSRKVMHYTNHQTTPVFSSDCQLLMPTHPAKARELLQKGRAVPHHVKGLFGIRLLGRTRAQSEVQDIAINIDPGSQTTGIAVVTNDEEGGRAVLAALEIKHRAFNIKATLTKRRSFRRNRRARLRYRAPRFDNRRRKPGTLPPSVDSLRIDTMRVVSILRRMFPITHIRLERNKFDPQLMMNPDINGVEYQRGTLFGWQVRAYVIDRDASRCVYCRRRNVRLELDHVRPRAISSDRVDNLVACCRHCNIQKGNQPIEQFLADQPDLLKRITEPLQRSRLASATHINAVLPTLIPELRTTGLPLTLTDAASVSWTRQRLGIRKTHCYDAALQGRDFINIESLPNQVLEIQPTNGRSKQKANVDRHGTPVGRPFRNQQRLPRHLRQHRPAAGHSDRHQRYGCLNIGTGDTIVLEHKAGHSIGRAVIKARGTRVAVGKQSASIANARIIARNPRHRIRWTAPSQQGHHNQDAVTLSAVADT